MSEEFEGEDGPKASIIVKRVCFTFLVGFALNLSYMPESNSRGCLLVLPGL